MRKLFYILLFIAISSVVADAQIRGFHVGGRFGIGESRVQSTLLNTTDKLAISGGVAANYQFNRWLGLNADFLLASSGIKAKGSTRTEDVLGSAHYYSYNERYDLVNAEIPLAGQLSVWMEDLFVRAYTGPSINFNLLSARSRIYDDAAFNDRRGYVNRELEQTNNVTYSMIYGIGLGALSKNDQMFFLDLRFSRGLTPFGVIGGDDAFNHYYCLTGGYVF